MLIALLTVVVVLSLIGLGIGLDDSPKDANGNVQVTTIGGRVSMLFLLPSHMALVGILKAQVIVQLWVWFVTPTFNIPAPSLVYAYGLSLFAALFSSFKTSSINSKTTGEYLAVFFLGPMYLLMIFGVAAFVQFVLV